jgi:hypothetical protein
MAITGKPSKPAPALPEPRANEVDVLSLINKGGSIAKAATPQTGPEAIKPMLVQLRLYPDLVEEIDAVRKGTGGKRHRPPSRHAWIVTAIEEKLGREMAGS